MSFNDEKVLIKLEHVSKKFRLGQYIGPVAALNKIKEIITRTLKGHSDVHPVVHERYEGDAERRQIWALRDISLEVKKGERIAILGRNGAGKSTLLKLIVGISTPTEGVITTHCRIVPLMGVGAGFNPELTGRENVYVYGGLLGVPASETDERYEDIVAFSEIHEFMDTPVKRYSKGMRARLGMAVALNLSPEVLVVDEVLAVGDVAFKDKCMAKMERMCGDGMTLLFVSHSSTRIRALCNRAIYLNKGLLVRDGLVDDVLNDYLKMESSGDPLNKELISIQESESFSSTGARAEITKNFARMLDLRINTEGVRVTACFDKKNRPTHSSTLPIIVCIDLEFLERGLTYASVIQIRKDNFLISASRSPIIQTERAALDTIKVIIGPDTFKSGIYEITAYASLFLDGKWIIFGKQTSAFRVSTESELLNPKYNLKDYDRGCIAVDATWVFGN